MEIVNNDEADTHKLSFCKVCENNKKLNSDG